MFLRRRSPPDDQGYRLAALHTESLVPQRIYDDRLGIADRGTREFFAARAFAKKFS